MGRDGWAGQPIKRHTSATQNTGLVFIHASHGTDFAFFLRHRDLKRDAALVDIVSRSVRRRKRQTELASLPVMGTDGAEQKDLLHSNFEKSARTQERVFYHRITIETPAAPTREKLTARPFNWRAVLSVKPQHTVTSYGLYLQEKAG